MTRSKCQPLYDVWQRSPRLVAISRGPRPSHCRRPSQCRRSSPRQIARRGARPPHGTYVVAQSLRGGRAMPGSGPRRSAARRSATQRCAAVPLFWAARLFSFRRPMVVYLSCLFFVSVYITAYCTQCSILSILPYTVYTAAYCLYSRILSIVSYAVYSATPCVYFRILFTVPHTVHSAVYCLYCRILSILPHTVYTAAYRL